MRNFTVRLRKALSIFLNTQSLSVMSLSLSFILVTQTGCPNIVPTVKSLLGDGGQNLSNGLNISAPSVSYMRASTSTQYTLTYVNTSTITLVPGDITINGANTGCIGNLTGSAPVFTYSINGCTSNGLINISVAANTALDLNSNPVPGKTSADTNVDNMGPTITCSAPTGISFTNNINVSVGACSDTISGCAFSLCSVDGGAWGSCTFTGLSNASHTFQVQAVDNVGNSSIMGCGPSVTVDTSTLAITTPAANSIFQSVVAVNGSCVNGLPVNISGSGVASATPATPACAAGSFASSVTLSAGDGNKTIDISQTDTAFGSIQNASINYVKDFTAPTGTSISAASSLVNSASVNLTLAATDPNLTQMNISSTACGGGTWVAYNTSTLSPALNPNSVNTIYAQFRDAVNNTSGCVTASVTHDNTSPTGSIIIDAGLGFTNNLNVTLSLTATDTNGINQMYVTNTAGCSSGGVWEPFNSTKAWTLATANTSNTVYVQFNDNAGNLSACYSDAITHDDIVPTLTLSGGPTPNLINSSASTVFNLQYNGATTSTLTNTDVSVVGAAVCTKSVTGTHPNWNVTLSNCTGDALIGISVAAGKSTDGAGNTDTGFSLVSVVTVDNTAPTVTCSNVGPWLNSASQDLAAGRSCTDVNSCAASTVECRYRDDSGSAWSGWSAPSTNCSGVWAQSLNPTGSEFEIRQRDLASNLGSSATCNIRIDLTPPPAPTVIAPASNINITLTDYTWAWSSVSDFLSGIDIYEYEIHTNASCTAFYGSNSTSGDSSNVTGLVDGSYWLKVRSRDMAGNYSSWNCSNYRVTVDATTPGPFNFLGVDSVTPANDFMVDNFLTSRVGQLQLNWQSSPGATSYDVEINDSLDNPLGSCPLQNTASTVFAVSGACSTSLIGGETYLVHITAKSATGLNTTLATNDASAKFYVTGQWNNTGINTTGAPTGKIGHTAIWKSSGNEMIIYGGYDGTSEVNTGARYNPSLNSWTALAPSTMARSRHTAIVDNSGAMLIWGGQYLGTAVNTNRGEKYYGSWSPITTTGEPSARWDHTALYFNDGANKMIIWGGRTNASTYTNTGAIFNIDTNSWTTMSTVGAPAARAEHIAVMASGNKMIIWGGHDNIGDFSSGAIYNTSTDTWSSLSGIGAPSPRSLTSGIYIGGLDSFLVWGGLNSPSTVLDSGALINVTSNTSWNSSSFAGVPSARAAHSMTWGAGRALIYGGKNGNTTSTFGDGAEFNVNSNSWAPLGQDFGCSPRHSHTSVWTGTEVLVWGGQFNAGSPQNTGCRYMPY